MMLSDAAILNTLQDLANEHRNTTKTGQDVQIGCMVFTIPAREHFDIRETLSAALQKHVPRLVTKNLIG